VNGVSTQIFGVLIVAIGVWIIHLGRKSAVKLRQAEHWPTTQAKIIKSEVRKRPGANAKFRFKIKYQYEVQDKQYTNNDIAIGGEIRSGRILAEKQQAKYPEGSTQTVFYNPDDAREAYLEPVVEGGGRLELFGGIGAIFIGVLLVTGLIGQ